MLISETFDPFNQFDNPYRLIERFKEAGFDAFDFSYCNLDFVKRDDFREYAKSLRDHADQIGIVCNQAHAPFPSYLIGKDDYDKMVFDCIVRSIEAASILGAKIIVVHPACEWRYKENIGFYNAFLPYAAKFNIRIAVENMWDGPSPETGRVFPCACSLIDDFSKTLDGLDPKYFVACVDIGHAEMFEKGFAAEMIKKLGSRVQALHIHDNDCIHDNHWIPGQGEIDFNNIAKALHSINYRGDITCEIIRDKNGDINSKLPQIVEFAKDFRKKIGNGI